MAPSPESTSPDRLIGSPPDRLLGLLDLLGAVLSIVLAFAARFETLPPPPPYDGIMAVYLATTVPLRLVGFYFGGLYRRIWRFAGLPEMERILVVTFTWGFAGLVLGALLLPWLGVVPARVPLSVLAIDGLVTVGLVTAPRLAMRLVAARRAGRTGRARKRVLIIGAGSAGAAIAKETFLNWRLGLYPVGFLDDDPSKRGRRLYNLPILGSVSDLAAVARTRRVDQLIIAMPSAPGTVIRSLITTAREAGLEARTVPSLSEILSGRVTVATLRPVQIEDLLRREPVRIDLDRVADLVAGSTVLVTGAGGSIGSELCRQLAGFGPDRLVLLGHGENSIYSIHRELEPQFAAGRLLPVIADIRDRSRISAIMQEYRPAIVFHAAAHKHVPMMEWNVAEAVTNNVLGTRNVLDCAVECGVDHFVLISTDKAVRPTSIMGATKRVAEQLVQEAAARYRRNYISVRFGNVLGSRGSVVPGFMQQIEAGGPVTVTHPEMRRYFMTIPEAVQLVLQAAVVGRGGEVLVLDMGEPIRIVDLARDLIRLSGLEEGRDIEIHFSGVRPGEKLYEELFFGAEMAEPTEHDKVLRARHVDPPPDLGAMTAMLVAEAQAGGADPEVRALLRRLVPDYQPESSATPTPGTRSQQPVA